VDGISFFVVIKEYHESIQKGYSFIENFLLSRIHILIKKLQEYDLKTTFKEMPKLWYPHFVVLGEKMR